jgi:hypothetical protein
MWRLFLRWLAVLIVSGACFVPAASAQRYPPPAEPESGTPTAALPYTFAFAATLLVLVIVCTPSRKQ